MKEMNNILLEATKVVEKFRTLKSHEGESFNLFQILIKKDEVRHSAFIGELLNPNGSHDKGNIFLEIFIERIKTCFPKHKINISYLKSNVSTEEYIGQNEDGTKGFIDIFINDLQNAIVIENKLDAGDQDKQLFKYKEFCKSYDTDLILFLTIDGKKASKESENGLKKGIDYLCISYQKHILGWLNECISRCDDHISLQNAIRQYRNHIETIVNKFRIMDELTSIIEQNLSGAQAIKDNYDAILIQVANALKYDVKERLEVELQKYPHINIEVPEDQRLGLRNEYFSSIYIDNLCEDRIIIESFNTKGRHFDSELFVARFIGAPHWYGDRMKIRSKEELFSDLNKYGKNDDRDEIINSITDKIVEYIDSRVDIKNK